MQMGWLPSRHCQTYDQNAVGVVTLPLTALPLETDFHNPVYSSSGIPDAKGSSVLVSDYELLAMEYEVLKEREQRAQCMQHLSQRQCIMRCDDDMWFVYLIQ